MRSGQFEAEGPEAGKDGASVTGPVALQPEVGWFFRDDDKPRSSGSLIGASGREVGAEPFPG